MLVSKKISENNEVLLFVNEQLIYKKSLNTGQFEVFDEKVYGEYLAGGYRDLKEKDCPNMIHVKAKVRFRTAAEGGRTGGVIRGYRPHHIFEYQEDGTFLMAFLGDLQFEEPEILEIGKEYKITIRFLFFFPIEHLIHKGKKWWLHEGSICVGEGEMLQFEVPE